MSILFIIGWAVFAAVSVFFWWVEYQDDKWSNLFELTSAGEGNWWSRDKNGYYSRRKALTMTSIYFAAAAGVPVLAQVFGWPGARFAPLIVAPFLAIAAFAMWSVIGKQADAHRKKRDEQFAELRLAREDPEGYRNRPFRQAFRGVPVWVAGPHFWDIRTERPGANVEGFPTIEDPADKARAVELLTGRIVKLAHKPESEWFKVGRANGL